MSGTEIFICPECRNAVAFKNIGTSHSCTACANPLSMKGGIIRLLPKTLQSNKIMEDEKWTNDVVVNKNYPAWFLLLERKNTINYLLDILFKTHNFDGYVLDLGAGICWASSLIKTRFQSSVVVAADVSLNALQKGIEVDRLIGGNIDYFVNCDIEKLPFRDESFDVIFGSAVLHHFFDPQMGMSEVYRVLKKGGKYIGTYEMALNGLLRGGWSRFGTPGIVSKQQGVRENVYTFSEWKRLFENAGFKDFEMPLERDWIYMKPHWLNYAYYKFMSFFPDFIPRLIGSGIGFVARKT